MTSDTVARQRVQIGGQSRHQRLALARTHLSDLAVMQGHTAQELHIEMAHSERAPRRFPNTGEGFDQEVVRLHIGNQKKLDKASVIADLFIQGYALKVTPNTKFKPKG